MKRTDLPEVPPLPRHIGVNAPIRYNCLECRAIRQRHTAIDDAGFHVAGGMAPVFFADGMSLAGGPGRWVDAGTPTGDKSRK